MRLSYIFSWLSQDCRKDILSFVRPTHDKHELERLPYGVRATTVGVISTCPDLGIYKKGWWQHSYSAADLGGVNNGDPGTYVASCSHDLAEEERDDAIFLVLVRERQRANRRRWLVKPWLKRRRLFGQNNILFQELEREFEGDYMSYIRMSSNMFAELLFRVGPRITKSRRQVTDFSIFYVFHKYYF